MPRSWPPNEMRPPRPVGTGRPHQAVTGTGPRRGPEIRVQSSVGVASASITVSEAGFAERTVRLVARFVALGAATG